MSRVTSRAQLNTSIFKIEGGPQFKVPLSILQDWEEGGFWPVSETQKWLERPNSAAYILSFDENVVAAAILAVSVEMVELLYIKVLSDFRQMGFGEALVRRLLDTYHPIQLEVRISNHTAIALYRKMGFRHIRDRPQYYSDGEDACVFMS